MLTLAQAQITYMLIAHALAAVSFPTQTILSEEKISVRTHAENQEFTNMTILLAGQFVIVRILSSTWELIIIVVFLVLMDYILTKMDLAYLLVTFHSKLHITTGTHSATIYAT